MNDCKQNWDTGNCQHIEVNGESLTIPLGTHFIGGRTAFVASSSGFPVTKHPSAAGPHTNEKATTTPAVKQVADNLAKDLIEIIDANNPHGLAAVIQALCIYIVARDHKVLDHGIKLGKDSK